MEILTKVNLRANIFLDECNHLSPVPLSIFTPILHVSNFLPVIFYFSHIVPPKPNKQHLNFKLIKFTEI